MGDHAGTLGGKDAAGTAAPRRPWGTSCGSGGADLQEEAPGGGAGLKSVVGDAM